MKIYYKDSWGDDIEVTKDMLEDLKADNFAEWVTSIDQQLVYNAVRKLEFKEMKTFIDAVIKEIFLDFIADKKMSASYEDLLSICEPEKPKTPMISQGRWKVPVDGQVEIAKGSIELKYI